MHDLGGVFDFDRIQCVIMIDDGSNENLDKNESITARMNTLNSRYAEPKRFRIEVIGS